MVAFEGKTINGGGFLCRARKSEWGKKAVAFLYSPYYISALALCVLLCYSFNLDVLGFGILALACVATLLLCEEATPILPVVLFSPFVPSMSWYLNGQSYGKASVAVFCIYGVAIFSAIVYHLVVFGGLKRLRFGGRLGAATVALGLGLFVSGFFSEGYKWSAMIHAFIQILPLCVLFFFLRAVIRRNKNTVHYLAVAAMAVGVTICCMLAETYLFYQPLRDSGFADKGFIKVGWGISNNIGAALLQAIPLTVMLACFDEKHPWFYCFVAVLMEVGIVFTYSRAALLMSAPICLACIIIACIKAENRKQILIFLCALIGVGVIGLVIFYGKIINMLQFYIHNGFNDRGRFDIWELGMELFVANPIFGVGQHFMDLTGGSTHSYFFHNTPIQFIAAGGLVGILTYAFYRVETVRIMLRKPTVVRLFLGLTVVGIVLTALLDTGFMRFFSQVFTVSTLLFAERDLDNADWFFSVPKLGNGKPLYIR